MKYLHFPRYLRYVYGDDIDETVASKCHQKWTTLLGHTVCLKESSCDLENCS